MSPSVPGQTNYCDGLRPRAYCSYSLTFTVVPVNRLREKVLPAGTVNELMFTVVHLTAELTSLSDEISPTQLLLSEAGLAAENVKRETRVSQKNIVNDCDEALQRCHEQDFISALEEISAAMDILFP